jgi:signal transduction histidine kinase
MGGLTGLLALDWAILTASLFNTILLLWLGLTMLLVADRRQPGVWLLGGGALTGALFFVSHTAILGQEMGLNIDGLNFWWRFGWLPVTIAPFAWYAVMLWHNGFWLKPINTLQRRHRIPFALMSLCAVGFLLLFLLGDILPTYEQIVQLNVVDTWALGNAPLALVAFPIFMVACILLALDALLHPAQPAQSTNQAAHARSRPWLLASTVTLLVVSALVVVFIARLLNQFDADRLATLDVRVIGVFDLSLSLLIAFAVLMMGQAVISYEVFSGKSLPRRGFVRHWRNVIVISAGYSMVVAGSLVAQLRPIYTLLLTTFLMVLFYALYSWRALVEREQFMRQLRPFVSNQHFVSHFRGEARDVAQRSAALLQAICVEILASDRAQIIPTGALGEVIGERCVYPPENAAVLEPPAALNTTPIAIAPEKHDGHGWAIPLWSERGLVGCLLIGGKLGGGIYTQEEIEIAQAGGERILDMLMAEKMARALIELQRKRFAQTRVIDLRARRTLHDEVLPAIHTTILELSAPARTTPALHEAQQTLSSAHRQIADLIRDMPSGTSESTAPRELTHTLRQTLDGEFSGAFDSITWEINLPLYCEALEAEIILGALREVVRNAAAHGRGDASRPLHLRVQIAQGDGVTICVVDDGVGIQSGAPSSSGSGLRLHRTLLALIGGTLTVEASDGGGTQAIIRLPGGVVQRPFTPLG